MHKKTRHACMSGKLPNLYHKIVNMSIRQKTGFIVEIG